MDINHDTTNQKFWCEERGHTAYLTYKLSGDMIYVVSTYVPKSLEGQGIASQLMQNLYNYAMEQELKPSGICSYAKVWLERHQAAMVMPS